MFHCVEKTLDIKTRNYKIRLWISQESVSQTVEEVSLQWQIVEEIIEFADYHTHADLVVRISELSDKINAIQVKFRHHKHKEGLMVYTVPF